MHWSMLRDFFLITLSLGLLSTPSWAQSIGTGTSEPEEYSNYSQQEIGDYMSKVGNKIKRVWFPLRDCAGKYGLPKILIRIDDTGAAAQIKIITSSGLKMQDEVAVKAIKDAQPFPTLTNFGRIGITIDFGAFLGGWPQSSSPQVSKFEH